MPPKSKKDPKKGKKDGSEHPPGPELYPLNPVDYLTLDFRTSLDLFLTSNEEIKLRAVGRLHKCLLDNPKFLDYLISEGLHLKFINALKTEDIYILRFAMSIMKMITSKPTFLKNFKTDDIRTLSDLIQRWFLETDDPLLKNLTIEVFRQFTKSSSKATLFLCTKEVISRIFEIVKTTDLLETQDVCLQIFYDLLESKIAENILMETPDFSLDLLLCFLQQPHHPLQSLVLRIIHKIAGWRRENYLKLLCEKKTMEIVTNLLLKDVQKNGREAYEILYFCLLQKGSDEQYSKTLEFLKFLEWSRNCSPKNQPMAANVITLMSRNDQLHQLLLDFGIDEILLSLIKTYQEKVLGNVCEAINNLTRHMHMCYKMTNEEMMTALIGVLKHPISTVPYGELALKTLHRFFKCSPQTEHVIGKSSAYRILIEKFYSASKTMTQNGFLAFLDIIQIFVRSKYVAELLTIPLYDTLMGLFKSPPNEDALEKILAIIKDLTTIQEFRDYFIVHDGITILSGHLDNSNYSILYSVLLVIKYLIRFKKPTCFFLDIGIVGRLTALREKLKTKTCICDEILQTLFDLSLTVKFFYTNSLSVTDKIRDQFYLLPDELLKSQRKVDEINYLTCDTPIYVVLFGTILKFQAFKLELPSKNEKNEEARRNTSDSAAFKHTARFRISLVPSALAMKFAKQLCKRGIRREIKDNLFELKHRKRCEDERLAIYIREVYEKLFFSDLAAGRRQDKIAFVARYVSKKMDDFNVEQGGNKRHIMRMHLIHLKDALKSNFIPIGYVRKGMSRERALLFKVICDQVDIPTSLNRHESGVFWNGVTLIKSNTSASSEPVLSAEFVVDLMGNVGELIPVDTSCAHRYFEEFSKY